MENINNEFLINYKIINIFGTIDLRVSEMVVNQLLILDYYFKKENVPKNERIITLQINSPGGNVSDGLAIIDTMNHIDAKVATVGLGICASMAAIILSNGTKGYRKITPNCEVLIHQPLGEVAGQASDIIIQAKHIENVRHRLNVILSENTGQTLQQISQDTDRDNIFDAKQALQYGLVDEIITNKKGVKK